MSKAFGYSKIGGLALTLRAGDHIVINKGEIIIEVVGVRGRQVKVAVKAKKDEIEIRLEKNQTGVASKLPAAF